MENIKYYSDELERSLLLLDKEAAEKLLKEASAIGSAIEIASQIITATLKKLVTIGKMVQLLFRRYI